MIRILLFFFIALALAQAEDSPLDLSATEQRKLVEQQLFPLLGEADRVVIYSLYPIDRKSLEPVPDAAELSEALNLVDDDAATKMTETDKRVAALARKVKTFQGYPILGKVVVKEPGEVRGLLAAVRGSMLTWAELDEEEDCHFPRHAVLVVKGKQRIRFSICFSCGNTFIGGTPESAAKAARVFHHFKPELRGKLEEKFVAQGIPHAPYAKHPPKAEK